MTPGQITSDMIAAACKRQGITRKLFMSSRRHPRCTRARREVARKLRDDRGITSYKKIGQMINKSRPTIKNLLEGKNSCHEDSDFAHGRHYETDYRKRHAL